MRRGHRFRTRPMKMAADPRLALALINGPLPAITIARTRHLASVERKGTLLRCRSACEQLNEGTGNRRAICFVV